MNKDVVSYYDAIAAEYDNSRFGNSYGRFVDAEERRILDRIIGEKRGRQILEMACGTGRLTGYATHGLDASEEMMAFARKRHSGVRFVRASATASDGRRIPYSVGTSVNYNFIDFRFRNDTDRPVQLCTWCEGDNLHAELRTTEEFPYTYQIVEEDHHFHKEDNGDYYRISTIYRETYCRKTGKLIRRELKRANLSKVMFDYSLIPEGLIR
jgi:HAD phosphatase, family IIIA